MIGRLGRPVGVALYRPFNSLGEDFLPSFLGMIGIPIDLQPRFPTSAQTVLLTQDAAADPKIVDLIEAHVRAGGNIVITSGLLGKLQSRGIDRIANLYLTGPDALVKSFLNGRTPLDIGEPMLIPQVHFITNDTWELASSVAGDNGFPMVTDSQYGKGHLFVITIPNNAADLYRLPAAILDIYRRTAAADLAVRLADGPSKVALYEYDNGTLIVESFNDAAVTVQVAVPATFDVLRNLETGEAAESARAAGQIRPRSLRPSRPRHVSRCGLRRIRMRRSRRTTLHRHTLITMAPEPSLPLLAGVELGGTKCICILGSGPERDSRAGRSADPGAQRRSLSRARSRPCWMAGARKAGTIFLSPRPGGLRAFESARRDSPRFGWMARTVPKPAGPTPNCCWPHGAALPDPHGNRYRRERRGARRPRALGRCAGNWRTMSTSRWVTGIGAGVIVNGAPVSGANHTELGHIRIARVPEDHFAGICPFHGDCLEGLAAGPAIAARSHRDPRSLLPDDPAWQPVTHALAQLCQTLVLTTGPRRIFLGGGVMVGQPQLFAMIRAHLQGEVSTGTWPPMKPEPASTASSCPQPWDWRWARWAPWRSPPTNSWSGREAGP